MLQRFYNELVEDLSRHHISQIKYPTLQFRDYSLPALRVLICEHVGKCLLKINLDYINISVVVEFNNDVKMMLNVKQISNIHCEC